MVWVRVRVSRVMRVLGVWFMLPVVRCFACFTTPKVGGERETIKTTPLKNLNLNYRPLSDWSV